MTLFHLCSLPLLTKNEYSAKAPTQSCWISISEHIHTSLPPQLPLAEFVLVLVFHHRRFQKLSESSRRIPLASDLVHSQLSSLMYAPSYCFADFRTLAPISKKKVANTEQRQVVNVAVVGSISSNCVTLPKSTATHPSISRNLTSSMNLTKSKLPSNITTKATKSHISLPISKSWRTLKLSMSQ